MSEPRKYSTGQVLYYMVLAFAIGHIWADIKSLERSIRQLKETTASINALSASSPSVGE
jgi:hypothetical protein